MPSRFFLSVLGLWWAISLEGSSKISPVVRPSLEGRDSHRVRSSPRGRESRERSLLMLLSRNELSYFSLKLLSAIGPE
jgi:hypothetical protein